MYLLCASNLAFMARLYVMCCVSIHARPIESVSRVLPSGSGTMISKVFMSLGHQLESCVRVKYD